MSVTLLVSHPDMSTLNSYASANIPDIFVTAAVSHPETSPLKANAPWNIPCMLVTAEVFHPVMSMLNVVISRNSSVMFVTWLVSHDPMPTQSALENAGSSSAQALTLHASCSSQPVSAQPESPAGRDGQACARTSSARQQTTRCHTSERRVGRPRLLAESGRVLQGGSLADRPAGGKGRGG